MENVIDTLKKWNIWERELSFGVPRTKAIQEIVPYLERKEVLVLKGVRRSGKSTLMKQLMDSLIRSGVSKQQVLYVNLEDYGFADHLTIALFDELLDEYLAHTKNRKKTYMFLDEVQKIAGWEKWVRTQYDLNANIKFIVSGSSASLLSKELSTLLTGRNISFVVRPLSFAEYSSFSKDGNESIEEYLKFGGFPEIVLESSQEKKEKLLQQYFEDIIHKDIIERYSVKNTKQIIDLARYLVSNSGMKVSVNKLSKMFGIAKDTIQSYISYMADAFLLSEVPFFSFSAKVKYEVSKLPKWYCVDLGFVLITKTTRSKNTGQLFENAVFQKLQEANKEIMYWNDGNSEVDFVLGTTAINVTSADTIPEREQKGLGQFKEKFKDFNTLLVTKSTKKERMIPLREFLSTKQ